MSREKRSERDRQREERGGGVGEIETNLAKLLKSPGLFQKESGMVVSVRARQLCARSKT